MIIIIWYMLRLIVFTKAVLRKGKGKLYCEPQITLLAQTLGKRSEHGLPGKETSCRLNHVGKKGGSNSAVF